MYKNLKSIIQTNDAISDSFQISIGTRQGCNLSPRSFNLYVNDIPNILRKAMCDPVSLTNTNINILVYADDMLILSKSEWGLKRSLLILEAYCKKWRLVINTKITKIMIFNNRTPTDLSFKIDGKQLDIANKYRYLG